MSEILIETMVADRWPDLETLFGRAGGDNGCWCQYWLLGADYHRRDRAENRRDLESQVVAERAGLLAYRDGRPVGWARLTPRSELAWLSTRFPQYEFGADDAWSLPCFFIARDARGSGVMRALIRFAVDWGRTAGVPIEGYPVEATAPGATRNRFTGVLPTFLEEGFAVAGRLSSDRVVVTTGAVAPR